MLSESCLSEAGLEGREAKGKGDLAAVDVPTGGARSFSDKGLATLGLVFIVLLMCFAGADVLDALGHLLVELPVVF